MKTANRFIGDVPPFFTDMASEELGSVPRQLGMVDVSHIIFGRMIQGMVDALSSDDPHQTLHDAFVSWSPQTAGDVLGMEPRLPWQSEHPLHYAKPWDSQPPGPSWRRRREDLMEREAKEAGVEGWQREFGWKGFGPPTDKLVEMEAGRLIRVRDIIAREGFNVSLSPGAIPYLAGEEVRFRPRIGWHRLASAISLDYDAIPMVVSWRRLIRLSEVESWVNVKNGSFTTDEAVKIFAAVFWDRDV